MTTVLFVHGTGVREEQCRATLKLIRDKFQEIGLSQIKVEECLWGDPLGVNRHKSLYSVPEYSEHGGNKSLTDKELEIKLWEHLYLDPLYELRVLAISSSEPQKGGFNELPPGEELDELVQELSITPELQSLLETGEIDTVFLEARSRITSSLPYRETIKIVSDPMGTFQTAIARAIVAEAMVLSEKEMGYEPFIRKDANLRDQITKLSREKLGPYQAAVGKWAVKKLLDISGRNLAQIGTPLIKWKRGTVMDFASPTVGDILLYQARGKKIQDFIRLRIEEVEQPVVVIGHSLGGVASFDMLAKEDLSDRVKLLITVGSQAPYFYEINALQSLEFGKSLPKHFPHWSNIYDVRDFLSFIGNQVFPDRVTDYKVDNNQPFPQAHSAYWHNPDTYTHIFEEIRNLK